MFLRPQRVTHVSVESHGMNLAFRNSGSFEGVRDKDFKYQIKLPLSKSIYTYMYVGRNTELH